MCCSPPGSCVHGILQRECPPPGNLPDPEMELASFTSPAWEGGFFVTSATWEAHWNPDPSIFLIPKPNSASLWQQKTLFRPTPPKMSSPWLFMSCCYRGPSWVILTSWQEGRASKQLRSPSYNVQRRKWQLTPVALPGEFHEQRSLEGYSPRGGKETEQLSLAHSLTPTVCKMLGLMLITARGGVRQSLFF